MSKYSQIAVADINLSSISTIHGGSAALSAIDFTTLTKPIIVDLWIPHQNFFDRLQELIQLQDKFGDKLITAQLIPMEDPTKIAPIIEQLKKSIGSYPPAVAVNADETIGKFAKTLGLDIQENSSVLICNQKVLAVGSVTSYSFKKAIAYAVDSTQPGFDEATYTMFPDFAAKPEFSFDAITEANIVRAGLVGCENGDKTQFKTPFSFDGFVLEISALFCGPCLQQIPHLSSLQTKYDKVPIYQIWSTAQDTPAKVEKKLAEIEGKMGEKIQYTAVVPEGDFFEAWEQEFEINGIPHVLVLKKNTANGKFEVVFSGHPGSDEFDAALKEVQIANGGEVKTITLDASLGVDAAEQTLIKPKKITTPFNPADLVQTKPVAVLFSATWCGPCSQMAPRIYEMAKENDKVEFIQFFACEPTKVTTKIEGIEKAGGIAAFTDAITVACTDQEAVEPLKSALELKGIPHVALFDKGGALVFNGHPAEPTFEKALKEIQAKY